MLFDLGSAFLALTQEMTAFNERSVYIRGILTLTAEEPYTFDGLFTPLDREQIFSPEADRVTKQAKLITQELLYLNRDKQYRTTVNYQDEQYKIIKGGDWSDFGYYTYLLELIIPQEG